MGGGHGASATGPRRRGREIALQVLFQWEAAGNSLENGLEWAAAEYDPGEEVLAFAAELAGGVTRHRLDIDGLIARYARDWDLERLARVDRNILRLGIYELLYAGRADVPPPVAINEAVELAKRYSGEEAARFVNGILGQLARDRGLAADGGRAGTAGPEAGGAATPEGRGGPEPAAAGAQRGVGPGVPHPAPPGEGARPGDEAGRGPGMRPLAGVPAPGGEEAGPR
ncbi:transcription antitermination factor NusB [Thermaerobacter litoralis]